MDSTSKVEKMSANKGVRRLRQEIDSNDKRGKKNKPKRGRENREGYMLA